MTLDQAVQQVLPSVRADLERLVRIPSVSADPAAAPDLRRSAALVASLLAAAGQSEVEVLAASAVGVLVTCAVPARTRGTTGCSCAGKAAASAKSRCPRPCSGRSRRG